MFKLLRAAAGVVLVAVLLSGCAGGRVSQAVTEGADQKLGPACSVEVRLLRARLLLELMERRLGVDPLARVRRSYELMQEAQTVPEALEVAGRLYRVNVALVVAERIGAADAAAFAVRGLSGALNALEAYVDLRVDLAQIKIAVLTACAGAKQAATGPAAGAGRVLASGPLWLGLGRGQGASWGFPGREAGRAG